MVGGVDPLIDFEGLHDDEESDGEYMPQNETSCDSNDSNDEAKLIIFRLSILDFSVVIETNVKGWHEQKSTCYYVRWQATFVFYFSIEIRLEEPLASC